MKRFYRFMAIIAWIVLLVILFVSFGNRKTLVNPAADKNFKTEVLIFTGNTQNISDSDTSVAKVYSIVRSKSELIVRLYKEGFFSEFAHDHIVMSNRGNQHLISL